MVARLGGALGRVTERETPVGSVTSKALLSMSAMAVDVGRVDDEVGSLRLLNYHGEAVTFIMPLVRSLGPGHQNRVIFSWQGAAAEFPGLRGVRQGSGASASVVQVSGGVGGACGMRRSMPSDRWPGGPGRCLRRYPWVARPRPRLRMHRRLPLPILLPVAQAPAVGDWHKKEALHTIRL